MAKINRLTLFGTEADMWGVTLQFFSDYDFPNEQNNRNDKTVEDQMNCVSEQLYAIWAGWADNKW